MKQPAYPAIKLIFLTSPTFPFPFLFQPFPFLPLPFFPLFPSFPDPSPLPHFFPIINPQQDPKMLNFLQKHPDNSSPSITGITRTPAITYGLSIESPAQFLSPFTTLSTHTFVNPHLKYQQARLLKMNVGGRDRINGDDWQRKTNINLIEEERVVNKGIGEPAVTFYHDRYQSQLGRGTSRFRLTKGQFTSFIHNQHKNQIFGPLQGHQRTLQRARQTKKSIMQQSISSLQKLKSNPSLLSHYKTPRTYNQKHELRRSRNQLHKSINLEVERRRQAKSPLFQLPRVMRGIGEAKGGIGEGKGGCTGRAGEKKEGYLRRAEMRTCRE